MNAQRYDFSVGVPMTLMKAFLGILLLFVVWGSGAAEVQNSSMDAVHDHARTAHVHGVVTMQVVLEGENLILELLAPAVNLLGFEHVASTEEERQALSRLKTILADADSLFQFEASRCDLLMQDIIFSGGVADHAAHDNVVPHDHSPQQERLEHGDIKARYHYHCASPQRLATLSVKIFVPFPGIQTLSVEWIVAGRQGAASLSHDTQTVFFK